MNAGATAERVYDALKRQICGGAFRPGDRLDAATLADSLHSSVTPVRDALHLLTGEGLVEARANEGFHLPPLDAPALQDLYSWNAELLDLATRSWSAEPGDLSAALAAQDAVTVAAATASLFAAVGRRSGNFEHRRAIGSANDRLHAVRLAEFALLDDVGDELAAISAAMSGSAAAMRKLIGGYHRRRRRAAANVVRTLYRRES